ncbi:STAS domain-containing protein [Magnetofaba australis]|uniref:Putative anti-sigma B factor antagonist n=1 Tax=Magnetofaba australis IT-1 TaxID=1434232 RepID=A0A1Y2JZ96_9PROT|nr:STAS domain-containing protein [Magnetofaba australis]OSM00227.1 putative anti-sigma B factor antagonist [Magnetofaba australis IT-1]
MITVCSYKNILVTQYQESLTIRMGMQLSLDSLETIERITRLYTGPYQDCIIDLSITQWVDSCGIGALLSIKDRVRAQSHIIQGASGQTAQALKLIQFDKVFTIRSVVPLHDPNSGDALQQRFCSL